MIGEMPFSIENLRFKIEELRYPVYLAFAEINLYGYAESASLTRLTTKGTKTECQYVLSFLRDLRVLRGEITDFRIQLELSR